MAAPPSFSGADQSSTACAPLGQTVKFCGGPGTVTVCARASSGVAIPSTAANTTSAAPAPHRRDGRGGWGAHPGKSERLRGILGSFRITILSSCIGLLSGTLTQHWVGPLPNSIPPRVSLPKWEESSHRRPRAAHPYRCAHVRERRAAPYRSVVIWHWPRNEAVSR